MYFLVIDWLNLKKKMKLTGENLYRLYRLYPHFYKGLLIENSFTGLLQTVGTNGTDGTTIYVKINIFKKDLFKRSE